MAPTSPVKSYTEAYIKGMDSLDGTDPLSSEILENASAAVEADIRYPFIRLRYYLERLVTEYRQSQEEGGEQIIDLAGNVDNFPLTNKHTDPSYTTSQAVSDIEEEEHHPQPTDLSDTLPASEDQPPFPSSGHSIDFSFLLCLHDREEIYQSNGTLTAAAAYCRSQLYQIDVNRCDASSVIRYEAGDKVWYELLTYERMWEKREPLRYNQLFGKGETFADETEYYDQLEEEDGETPEWIKFFV
ncbi:MAG: hypothetical protein Q9169_005196 [Polycauliona sp. 2 TL-2023]